MTNAYSKVDGSFGRGQTWVRKLKIRNSKDINSYGGRMPLLSSNALHEFSRIIKKIEIQNLLEC